MIGSSGRPRAAELGYRQARHPPPPAEPRQSRLTPLKGLDLARLAQQNRFAFVDGLFNLFLPSDADSAAPPATPSPTSPLPVRGARTITPRTPPPQPHLSTTTPRPAPAAHAPATPAPTFSLTAPTLSALEAAIHKAQAHLTAASPKRHLLLVLDAPDFLLAAAEDAIGPAALASALLSLRASVHATVLSLSADTPLVASAVDAIAQDAAAAAAGGHHTPLEAAHAAFLVGQAHVADWCLSLRLLDTGVAADVSGVLRVTRGDNGEEAEKDADEEKAMEEKEVLYYIGGDGGVRVFERGAGGREGQ